MFKGNEGPTKKTQITMMRERIADRDQARADLIKLSIMRSIYSRLFAAYVKPHHGLIRVPIKAKCKLQYGELMAHYSDLAKLLSAQNPKVLEKTSAEKEVAAALKAIGSCHLLTSYWVGRKNLDLLLLGLTGSAHGNGTRFTGAMIEVDGLVHTYAPKLLGDGDKDSLVSLLGILPVRVQNDHVRQARIFEMLRQLCVYTSIDTRARDRLKARIYLVTLFLNWNFERLGAVFGFDHEKAIEKIAARLTEVD